ncbi:MAG: UpxY family transcription antiterminator [Acidobacteriaceae bacterium]|nr:UpxY family transcription antiterminator [Acidobacteriaceae bacterium]MBV9781857.1 UpxY family transcription antiterminator [Acidobacteriaceae bacterium]
MRFKFEAAILEANDTEMGLAMAEACQNSTALPPWYALTVKPGHDRAVSEQLCAKSLESYLPLYTSHRRWSDRVKTLELPLFRGYVFCRFTFEDRRKVLSIPSVVSVVGFGGIPCPVGDEEIELIKSLVGSGLPIMPWPVLRVGQRVRVSEGPLCDLEGILIREKGAYRVVVNLDIFQRAVAVEIDRKFLLLIGNMRENKVAIRPRQASHAGASLAQGLHSTSKGEISRQSPALIEGVL